MGKLCRSHNGGRDLRPHAELCDSFVDFVDPAYDRNAIGLVFDPALDKVHDGDDVARSYRRTKTWACGIEGRNNSKPEEI